MFIFLEKKTKNQCQEHDETEKSIEDFFCDRISRNNIFQEHDELGKYVGRNKFVTKFLEKPGKNHRFQHYNGNRKSTLKKHLLTQFLENWGKIPVSKRMTKQERALKNYLAQDFWKN